MSRLPIPVRLDRMPSQPLQRLSVRTSFGASCRPLNHVVSFAVPNDAALEAIADVAPIIECGGGTGYWCIADHPHAHGRMLIARLAVPLCAGRPSFAAAASMSSAMTRSRPRRVSTTDSSMRPSLRYTPSTHRVHTEYLH